MTIERLKELKREVERAIEFHEYISTMIDMTEGETKLWFLRAGACPGIHHFIIGDFAITDLRAKRPAKGWYERAY